MTYISITQCIILPRFSYTEATSELRPVNCRALQCCIDDILLLLHCLSLNLSPPPQVLLHVVYGPNSLQPPSIGAVLTTVAPSTHCPLEQTLNS